MISGDIDKHWTSEITKQTNWHTVHSGYFLGTVCWFSDGKRRRVRGEKIWRCMKYCVTLDDGNWYTVHYAYNLEASRYAYDHPDGSYIVRLSQSNSIVSKLLRGY